MSYSYLIEVILSKVVEGEILMLAVAFLGYNMGFFGILGFFGFSGIDPNQANSIVSFVAPVAGIIFVSSVGRFTLKAAKQCGGVFSGMSNFGICAVTALINIVLFLAIANIVLPFFFPSNFVAASYNGYDYTLWIGCFAFGWYFTVLSALLVAADQL